MPVPPLLPVDARNALWRCPVHRQNTALSVAARSSRSFDAARWVDDPLRGPGARVHVTALALTGRQLGPTTVSDHSPSWSRR